MHHRMLIPEGRSEYEWFRLLSDVLETGDVAFDAADADTPAFGTVIGVVPTHDGAVADVYDALRTLRRWIVFPSWMGMAPEPGRSTRSTIPTRCRKSSCDGATAGRWRTR